MNRLASVSVERCSESATGEHSVAEAAAGVCCVDLHGVWVDVDAVCELCGATGQGNVLVSVEHLEWEAADADDAEKNP